MSVEQSPLISVVSAAFGSERVTFETHMKDKGPAAGTQGFCIRDGAIN